MGKYKNVFAVSWSSGFVYRLNFIMWRVRMVLQLLSVYFLWAAVLIEQPSVNGYSNGELLTYIIGTSMLRSLVFSSRSMDIQSDISSGDLSNYLVKPVNYFGYWLSRDLADKLLNILFSLVEVTLLVFILRPPLVTPPSISHVFWSLAFGVGGMLLYFFFSSIVSFTTFWMPEGNGWPQRFLIFVLLEFVSGGLFPVDMLPGTLGAVLTRLPTAYFLNTPLQIFLGRFDMADVASHGGLLMMWLVLFAVLSRTLFHKGLKLYGAYGR